MTFIESLYRETLKPIPSEPIYEWAARTVLNDSTAPIPGYYRIENTPQLRAVLDTFQDDSVRHQITLGPNQGGRTKCMEVGCIWSMLFRPGPAQWNTLSEDKAKSFAEKRFWPMADQIKAMREIYPKNHDQKRIQEITFANGMPFTMQGANETNLQSDSIQNQFNDEVYAWKPGRLAEAHRRGDVSFAATRKTWDNSVTGDEGSQLEQIWNQSTRGEWCFECDACNLIQEFDFHRVKWDTNEKTKPGGEYNFRELEKTVRYECAGNDCSRVWLDSQESRAIMNESGRYVYADPSSDIVGHRFNILCVNWPGVSWTAWVKEFLQCTLHYRAFGDAKPLMLFWTRRMAQFWEESRFCSPTIKPQESKYSIGSPSVYAKEQWPEEVFRFLSADKQEWGYPFVARAARAGGASRLIDRGTGRACLKTYDDIAAKADELGIQPRCVLIDCSFEMREVFGECAKRGWTAFRGDPRESFDHPTKDPVTGEWKHISRPYSKLQWGDPGMGKREQARNTSRGVRMPRLKLARYFEWSNLGIKNLLDAFRSGRAKIEWEIPNDAGQDYLDEMRGEHRYRKMSSGTGGREISWWSNRGRTGKLKPRPNHAWDCECQIICAMVMQGLIDLDKYARAIPDVGNEGDFSEESEYQKAA